ncbi:cyclic lactone autoinducer peptide [Clostridiaceae bacterium]|jgi:AgrD protein|nr:cyclic lactone autoinducer peptide [Clostridium sp.]NBI70133.1 cyclic lactone autoinducer peptide [Clostridiaceae bacterium]
MRNVMKKLSGKFRNRNWAVIALNAMAILAVVQNMNAGCLWIDHQPEIPDGARHFRRF